jgi:hypothetical protein
MSSLNFRICVNTRSYSFSRLFTSITGIAPEFIFGRCLSHFSIAFIEAPLFLNRMSRRLFE